MKHISVSIQQALTIFYRKRVSKIPHTWWGPTTNKTREPQLSRNTKIQTRECRFIMTLLMKECRWDLNTKTRCLSPDTTCQPKLSSSLLTERWLMLSEDRLRTNREKWRWPWKIQTQRQFKRGRERRLLLMMTGKTLSPRAEESLRESEQQQLNSVS